MGSAVIGAFAGTFVSSFIVYSIAQALADKFSLSSRRRVAYALSMSSLVGTAVGTWSLAGPRMPFGAALVAGAFAWIPMQCFYAALDWKRKSESQQDASLPILAAIAALVVALGGTVASLEMRAAARPSAPSPQAAPIAAGTNIATVPANSAPEVWVRQQGAEAAFVVQMPGSVQREEAPMDLPGGPPVMTHTVSSVANSTGCELHVASLRFDPANVGAGATVESVLEGSRDGAQRAAGIVWSSEAPIPVEGGGGLRLVGSIASPDGGEVQYEARVYVTGLRVVQAHTLCPGRVADDATRIRFFDSLVVGHETQVLPHRGASRAVQRR